jgi:hypothetical protein
MIARAALLLAVLAAPAAAQPMTPQAFEAFSAGRTLHFTLNGVPFGAEQYFPGRRSVWRFDDGTCQDGRWWAEGERICFSYEGGPPQCWRFREAEGGLAAVLVEGGLATGFELALGRVDDAPLACPGPRVGT